MDKILEVREYDTITCNEKLIDNTDFRYLDELHFRELEHFIKDYTSSADSTDVLDFMKIGYRRNVGDIITINSYVGIIELPSGFQIEILPKISFDGEDSTGTNTKRIFLNMLRSLREFEGKSFGSASLNADRMNLYEVFISMYLQETSCLIKHGLKSSYVEQEENLRYYKGRLNVSEHIRNNVSHKERFFMRYDEYNMDRPENRLIKATLIKLQKTTRSYENGKRVQQLLESFELVNPSTNFEKDFSRVCIDRNMQDYNLLIQWAKIFLFNNSFTTFSGKNTGRAILFPMEQVFEAYVAKMIKQRFESTPNAAIRVTAQDNGYYLFDQPRKFRVRPDIVIRSEDGSTIIMDTKWKRLNSNPQCNYGISQSDMYQMYAYAKKYQTPDIYLLYPLNEAVKDLPPIEFNAEMNRECSVTVKVFFVDLVNIQQSINTLYELCQRE